LHSRFNEYAIAFLEKALEKLLKQQIDVRPLLSTAKIFNPSSPLPQRKAMKNKVKGDKKMS